MANSTLRWIALFDWPRFCWFGGDEENSSFKRRILFRLQLLQQLRRQQHRNFQQPPDMRVPCSQLRQKVSWKTITLPDKFIFVSSVHGFFEKKTVNCIHSPLKIINIVTYLSTVWNDFCLCGTSRSRLCLYEVKVVKLFFNNDSLDKTTACGRNLCFTANVFRRRGNEENTSVSVITRSSVNLLLVWIGNNRTCKKTLT